MTFAQNDKLTCTT